jgi:YidC/Oxa1 family membrane protein insertase
MDKEVVFFLNPDETTPVSPFAELTNAGTRRIGVELAVEGGTSTYRFTLYGGRRRYVAMEAAGLEALDKPGVFGRLMVYVIRLLNWFYRVTGNYGWAIILFTILMRIVLFPLMRKQYHSMARIQQIQPKLKRIQQKYKDNKEEMQKQTLEIYRKEKVNPMSGCLPMVVQLPIIIIIWRALLYASEQIHLSPGFLWVPDLSLHDPYFILVVVTTLIMLVQQYFMTPMTPDAAGPQKYMGYFFPILMGFLLWRFPAGLWLYYLLTTAAQVGQQAFVNWEMARATANRVAEVGDDIIDIDEPTTKRDDGDTT